MMQEDWMVGPFLKGPYVIFYSNLHVRISCLLAVG